MVKCRNGRKHVMVKGYRNKTGHAVARYERGCPTRKTVPEGGKYSCCVCGEEYPVKEVKTFLIKNQEKSICPGCADTIHGLQ